MRIGVFSFKYLGARSEYLETATCSLVQVLSIMQYLSKQQAHI